MKNHLGNKRIFIGICLLLLVGMIIIFCYQYCFHRLQIRTDEDIVFQSWDRIKDNYWDTDFIYFMRSDGSDLVRYQLGIKSVLFQWSPDKHSVISVYPHNGVNNGITGPLVINDSSIPCGTYSFTGRQKWISENEILTVIHDSKDAKHYHPMIVLWNKKTCSITKILYDEYTYDYFSYPDLSIYGDIVFTQYDYDDVRLQKVIMVNGDSGNRTIIDNGINPSWSPDGRKIVYMGEQGIYIYDISTEKKEIFVDLSEYYEIYNMVIEWDDIPPMPVWSPDMKFILFHRKQGEEYVIEKINVNTLEEKILFYGGIYPDWK